MDKMVEMEIILVIGVIAVVGAYLGQFNLLTIVVSGLIGFLSHGIITETTPAEEPAQDEAA